MRATALAEPLTVAAIVPFIALLSGQPVGQPFKTVIDGLWRALRDAEAAIAMVAARKSLSATMQTTTVHDVVRGLSGGVAAL